MGVSGQCHALTALYPQERTPSTHYTGGWVAPRAGLDTEARGKVLLPLPGIEPWSPCTVINSVEILHYVNVAIIMKQRYLLIKHLLSEGITLSANSKRRIGCFKKHDTNKIFLTATYIFRINRDLCNVCGIYFQPSSSFLQVLGLLWSKQRIFMPSLCWAS
jgi:hypothetical protein